MCTLGAPKNISRKATYVTNSLARPQPFPLLTLATPHTHKQRISESDIIVHILRLDLGFRFFRDKLVARYGNGTPTTTRERTGA